MVALTITAVDVGEDAVIEKVEFGEAVGLGDAVYKNPNDAGRWHRALNDSAVHAGSDGIAIALHAIEDAGRFGAVVTSGKVFITGGLTEGTVYVVGDAAGDIQPDVDLGSGDFKTILGIGGDLGTGTTNGDEFTMQTLASGHVIA